ncbi:hypothetical protein FFLO_00001 [Filobasidium floriforme]|uniref:Glutathione S-transferase n=1 Tax=Filobasidium floriforme TaxID=5210 RepID=A0A8K0NVY9_9TREE|nr:hypothetical protein FFLO_00001 [Filobasidium floriforme]
MPADILIHHLNKSRSERLCECCLELGLDYKVKVWQRTSDFKAPPDLKAIHPLGKSPIAVVDGKTLSESAFILTKFVQMQQTSPAPFDDEDTFWSHYAEGSFMLFLQMSRVLQQAASVTPFYAKTISTAFVGGIHDKYLDIEIQKHFDFVEAGLAKSATQWFGGKDDPSLADYMMLYPIHACISQPDRVKATIGEKTRAWLKAVEARPAYKKGLERQTSEEKAKK